MMFEDRDGYAAAVAQAVPAVQSLDPELVAAERGVRFDEGTGEFEIPLLGSTVRIRFPGGEVASGSGDSISGAAAVVSLHYLYYRGEPQRGEGWLAYRDMPGGRDFSRAFESMAGEKLAARYGEDTAAFREAARGLGGAQGEDGNCSFILPALPRIPLMVVLWPACEEFPGAARVLFRPSAPYYLHTEDLAALGVIAAERLAAGDSHGRRHA